MEQQFHRGFRKRSGVTATIGREDCIRLDKGHSFTETFPSLRHFVLSLVAETPLTYCLDTNQGLPFIREVGEAPFDDRVYGRKNEAWERAASDNQLLELSGNWESAELHFRRLHFSDLLEVMGTLTRESDEDIQPGAAFLLGVFPIGYRPAVPSQNKISMGANAPAGPFHTVWLTLETDGALSVTVLQPTRILHLNELFDLSLEPA